MKMTIHGHPRPHISSHSAQLTHGETSHSSKMREPEPFVLFDSPLGPSAASHGTGSICSARNTQAFTPSPSQQQIGFNIMPPAEPALLLLSKRVSTLEIPQRSESTTSSHGSHQLMGNKTSILSQQLKKMQVQKERSLHLMKRLPHVRSSDNIASAYQHAAPSYDYRKRASSSIPLTFVKENDDAHHHEESEFGDLLNVRTEDHVSLYGLRYDAVGMSSVLSQEEIEAMSLPPLPQAAGPFSDAVIHIFK